MSDWKDYYKRMNLEPRPLLIKGLNFINENNLEIKNAIDLGCGNGKDSLELLKMGYKVLGIDSSPESEGELKKNIPEEFKRNFEFQNSTFEELELPNSDLIYAGFSIPFTESLPELIHKITNSLNKKGVFIANFFGNKDDWKHLSLISEKELIELLNKFEIFHFEEIEKDQIPAVGNMKHWHIFDVIAQKK